MKQVKCAGVNWIDLENPSKGDLTTLEIDYGFHTLNLEDALSKIQLTKVEQHKDYVFIILRFPVLCEDHKCVPTQIAFFVGKDYLITIHEKPIWVLDEISNSCQDMAMEFGKLPPFGIGSLLYRILDSIINSLFPIVENLMDRLEGLEEAVFDQKKTTLFEVTKLRRDISDLRRITAPLRRVINEIELGVKGLTGEEMKIYFADLRDHIEKIWELSETAKEIIDIYKDTDFTLYQERMNRALVILTVIFTVTIPATWIGTFYGMNVVLPGGFQDAPTFLGPYTTFIIILLVTLVPAMIMLAYFKRLGWL
jgi:magnesium transporter